MRTFAVLLIALTARAQTPNSRPVGAGVNFFSLEKEAGLGAQLARAQLKNSTPTAYEDVLKYVDRLGARIAASMPGTPRVYRFAVIAMEPTNRCWCFRRLHSRFRASDSRRAE